MGTLKKKVQFSKSTQSGIYKITNLNNNKVYVGLSKDLHYRFRSHKHHLIKGTHFNKHLQRSYDKGHVFEFEILELCKEEDLYVREKYWGDVYNVLKDGYNMVELGNPAPVIKGKDKWCYDHTLRTWYHDDKGLEILTSHDMRKKYGISSTIYAVIQGKRTTVKGWRLTEELTITRNKRYNFIHTSGIIEMNITQKNMIEKYEEIKSLDSLISGKSKSSYNWSLYKPN